MAPSKTTTVDNLYLYDPDSKAQADKFVREAPKTSAASAVPNMAALVTITDTFEGLKSLIFDMHGKPG